MRKNAKAVLEHGVAMMCRGQPIAVESPTDKNCYDLLAAATMVGSLSHQRTRSKIRSRQNIARGWQARTSTRTCLIPVNYE